MNKKELIRAVAKQSLYEPREVSAIIENTLSIISSTLKDGEKVQLVGFGIFETKERDGHSGINPRTKQTITISPRKAPVFKASKKLKGFINGEEVSEKD